MFGAMRVGTRNGMLCRRKRRGFIWLRLRMKGISGWILGLRIRVVYGRYGGYNLCFNGITGLGSGIIKDLYTSRRRQACFRCYVLSVYSDGEVDLSLVISLFIEHTAF